MLGIRYLKVPPTTYVMHFSGGRVVRQGAGLSFFYYAPTAEIVIVPLASVNVPFIFSEVTADFQDVTIQGQLTYRVVDAARLAQVLDFSVNPRGRYRSEDPTKLADRLIHAAQILARAFTQRLVLSELLVNSAGLSEETFAGLAKSPSVAMLGVEVLGLSILSLKATPDMAKALQAAAREDLLRKADEAIYARRNAAVDLERTIKENELNTQIAVEQKNRAVRETQMAAEIAVEDRRAELVDRRVANQTKEADARAHALRAILEPMKEVDWRTLLAASSGGSDPQSMIAMAFRELAENAGKIGELNISSELLQSLLESRKQTAMGAALNLVIVTRETRMQGLRSRWVTGDQASFMIRNVHVREKARRGAAGTARKTGRSSEAADSAAAAEASIVAYKSEEDAYQRSLEKLRGELDFGLPIKLIERALVPNYDFWNCAAVIVVGQDGLVANTAKYVGELPIVAVNPDPRRYDGILLPFQANQARAIVGQVLDGRARSRQVTLAEVTLSDGQRLRAFNDFYLGAATHVSARYTLEVNGQTEAQSSSGLLVSTGAGSTGWISSVFNMAAGVARFVGGEAAGNVRLAWDDRRLIWTVREPFLSKQSQIGLVAGVLPEGQELIVESLMPSGGVIFSDGVEADSLPFDSGTIAHIGVSQQRTRLVVR